MSLDWRVTWLLQQRRKASDGHEHIRPEKCSPFTTSSQQNLLEDLCRQGTRKEQQEGKKKEREEGTKPAWEEEEKRSKCSWPDAWGGWLPVIITSSQQDVLRLQVCVYQVQAMQVCYTFQQLPPKVAYDIYSKWPILIDS